MMSTDVTSMQTTQSSTSQGQLYTHVRVEELRSDGQLSSMNTLKLMTTHSAINIIHLNVH